MMAHLSPSPFVEVLRQVLEPELKQLKTKFADQLGTVEARTVIQEAWELALSEAQGMHLVTISSKLLLFPALKETAQALGRLIFAACKEDEDEIKESEVALLRLGRSKLVIQTRKQLKRARATLLLRGLSAALRRQDREVVSWLSQSLHRLGYAVDVASAWYSIPTFRRALA